MVESAVYLGTATQMVVKLAGDVPLTVLVPNADEAERQRLPGAGRPGAPVVGAGAHARRRGERRPAAGTTARGGTPAGYGSGPGMSKK